MIELRARIFNLICEAEDSEYILSYNVNAATRSSFRMIPIYGFYYSQEYRPIFSNTTEKKIDFKLK